MQRKNTKPTEASENMRLTKEMELRVKNTIIVLEATKQRKNETDQVSAGSC